MEETRPNPDVLLSHVTHQEKKESRGHLRLFFGMAAGVGKTYAMLQAARDRLKEGTDVRIGIVETHGRVETQKLIEGIPAILRKKIEYRGTLLEEMDLDEVLKEKPQLVLVDELAHTNVPGSRHEKRYQDVVEILDAGIDVYSTMNVQHLESRADVVGLITAVTVRETVPDSILDLVDQIELIDITPHELIERLREGKVYSGAMSQQALDHFFQEGNLNALREIVLRVTADKLERDMRIGRSLDLSAFKTTGSEKLLVAISNSPFSERLIRTGRRIVEDLGIPWVAVHVDTGKVLSPEDQNNLVRNLDLAREMGAETITLHGTNIAQTISEYARDQNVIQMIVGRPTHRAKWWRFSGSYHFFDQLIRLNPNIDVTVLQKPKSATEKQRQKPDNKFEFPWKGMGQAIFWVLAISLFNYYILNQYLEYRAVGFIFLLLVVILSIFLPFTAVLLAAVLSGLIWNYFFIPPQGTFSIHATEDVMMFAAFLVIAAASGFLTFQIKKNQKILKDREEKTRALFEILKSMTLVRGTQAIIDLSLSKIENIFNADCCVLLAGQGRLSNRPDFGKLDLTENDLAVAAWSFDHGRMAGWSTSTLPAARVLCLSLKSGETKFGVLVLHPKVYKKLDPDQESLLISIVNQVGVVLAKQRHDEQNREADLVKESEKLHQTLLNAVSHEIRTPLTAVMGAATALQSQITNHKDPSSMQVLAGEIVSASERLNHVFQNLLEVTRLESGALKLKHEWFDVSELIKFAIERQKKLLADHQIKLSLPEENLYFYGDYDLLEHALSNLLLNAANYSPPGSVIEVVLRKRDPFLLLEVSDRGPGIPEISMPYLFDKFYRLPGTPTGGLGLGLSITKNLVELHNGTIGVVNRPEGGATFTISLPYQEPPAQVQESS